MPHGDEAARRPIQLPLGLEHPPRLGREDFLVAPPNAAAHALITAWPAWPDRFVLLTGPAAAGKTHLATIWAEQAGARFAPATAATVAALGPADRIVVEDVDRAGLDEQALFHLLNRGRELGAAMLLTARSGPGERWPALRDLASRLRALPRAEIAEPDEAMIRAVLVKLLHDRQLAVEAGLVDYLALRIERSLAAARNLVQELDREGLARARPITRALAAKVLERLATADEP